MNKIILLLLLLHSSCKKQECIIKCIQREQNSVICSIQGSLLICSQSEWMTLESKNSWKVYMSPFASKKKIKDNQAFFSNNKAALVWGKNHCTQFVQSII